MIRIDAVWLATAPMDMRGGADSALARVVGVFGAAHAHTAYLFANRRGNRLKVLVHDGLGIWLAARRPAPRQVHLGRPRQQQLPTRTRPAGRPGAGIAVAAHRQRRVNHPGLNHAKRVAL